MRMYFFDFDFDNPNHSVFLNINSIVFFSPGGTLKFIFSSHDLYITYSSQGSVYVCGDLNSRTASESDCPENYDTSILANLGMDDCIITTHDSDNTLPVRDQARREQVRKCAFAYLRGRKKWVFVYPF